MEEEGSESSSPIPVSSSKKKKAKVKHRDDDDDEEDDDLEEEMMRMDEDDGSSGTLEEAEYSIHDVLVPVGKQRRPPTPPIPLKKAKKGKKEDEEEDEEEDDDDDESRREEGGDNSTSASTSSRPILNGLHHEEDEELAKALKASSIAAANERLQELQKQVNQDILTRRKTEEAALSASSSSSSSSSKKQRTRAILRGLDFLYQIACDEGNFVSFGADVVMCLFDLATQAADPIIRQSALQRAEILGYRWKEKFPTLQSIAQLKKEAEGGEEEEEDGEEMDVDDDDEDDDDEEGKEKQKGGGASKKKRKRIKLEGDDEEEEEKAKPDKDDINTAIRGAHLLIRMGLSARGLVQELQTFLKDEGFKAKDFVNFDPRRRPVTLPRDRPAHRLAEAIDVMFYSQRVGVDLGGTLEDVLPLLRFMRPYKTCEEIGWDEWEDQFLLINNTINVCSCAGELRLQPALFPHEYAMLCHPETFKWPMEVNDCHLIGDLCHCLAIFGYTPSSSPSSSEEAACIQALSQAHAFLLATQCPNGSWPLRDGSLEPYDLFLACHAAIAGLLDIQAKGYGPNAVQVADLLRTINTDDPHSTTASTSTPIAGTAKKRPPSVTCCGDRRPLVLKKFDGLAELYRLSAGVSLDLKATKAIMEEHDPTDPEPADFRISGVSLRQLSDLQTLRGRASKMLTEMMYWKEKGPGQRSKKSLTSAAEGAGAAAEGGGGGESGVSLSKAQIVSKKIAASKGLDAHGFKNALQIYSLSSSEASISGGSGSEGTMSTSVTLGASKVDLFGLFQAVGAKGGAGQINGMEGWQAIAKEINLPTTIMDRARRLKDVYEKTLLGFEEYWLDEYEAKGKRAEMLRYMKEKSVIAVTAVKEEGGKKG